MKTSLIKFSILLAIAFSFTNCKDKAADANISEAEAAAINELAFDHYTVNIEDSRIEWKGFKPTGSHNGTITLNKGFLKTDENQLQSGTFLIDMNTITVTDLESGNGKESLEGHLKGIAEGKEDHFFDVAKWPNATFEITGVDTLTEGKTKLSGNLEIKGQKHNISFPVTVTNQDNILKMESEAFTIDRTKWGINYASKSVFDDLGNKFINDDMELKIVVIAKKS